MQFWDGLNPEELSKMLQETYLQIYEQVHRGQKMNAKNTHNKCWFNLVNRSEMIKKIYLWHYFWQHFYTSA